MHPFKHTTASGRVAMIGDVHGNIDFLDRASRRAYDYGIDTLIQLGDYGLYWPNQKGNPFEFLDRADKIVADRGQSLFLLDGNHEQHDLLDRAVREITGDKYHNGIVSLSGNTAFMTRGSVAYFDDVPCLFLGGAISVDAAYRTEGQSWWRQEKVCLANIETAMDSIDKYQPTVFFTHAVPDNYNVPGLGPIENSIWHRSAVEVRGEQKLLGQVGVYAQDKGVPFKLFVHGHTHVYYKMAHPYLDSGEIIGLAHDECPDLAKSCVFLSLDGLDIRP